MTFPALARLPGFYHRFTLRHPEINAACDRDVAIRDLWHWHLEHVEDMGFSPDGIKTAEQIHSSEIAVVSSGSSTKAFGSCDGMVTNLPNIVLGIYVADCCAVYLADPRTGAYGIVHSGKKGTEGRIAARGIEMMRMHFGSAPEDIVVQLSPCIRPPAYEVDFARQIREQVIQTGIRTENLHDEGICTSSDLTRFYSYRMEKGRTGRMLALLGRREMNTTS